MKEPLRIPTAKTWCGCLFVVALAAAPFAMLACPTPSAGISVSPRSHHFARNEIVWEFEVWNSGAQGTSVDFFVTADEPWIDVDPAGSTSSGTNDRVPVLVTIDRNTRPVAKANFNSGTITVVSTVGTRTVDVTVAPDYFAEAFSLERPFDLDGAAITFTQDGSPNFYHATIENGAPFPPDVGANADTIDLDFSLSDTIAITPAGGRRIRLYERTHTRFFVSEDGYVSFDALPKAADTLDEHFAAPRISALGTDLSPLDAGQVFVSQSEQKITVTYLGVTEPFVLPEGMGEGAAEGAGEGAKGTPSEGSGEGASEGVGEGAGEGASEGVGEGEGEGDEEPVNMAPNDNSFAVEMFFDGRIRISYSNVDALRGIAGLSIGGGLPADFVASDLSELESAKRPE